MRIFIPEIDLQENLRSRRRSSTRGPPTTSFKRKTSKPKIGSRKRAKSVKEVRHRSDSHQLDAFSDFPDRPLIPKESGRGPGNKRVPKITFKAKSFEYDDATEVHTVQVGVEEGVDFIKLFLAQSRVSFFKFARVGGGNPGIF